MHITTYYALVTIIFTYPSTNVYVVLVSSPDPHTAVGDRLHAICGSGDETNITYTFVLGYLRQAHTAVA